MIALAPFPSPSTPSTSSTLSDTHPTPEREPWPLLWHLGLPSWFIARMQRLRLWSCTETSNLLPTLFPLCSLLSLCLHLSLSLKHSLCCLTFSIIFIISSQRAHFLNFTAPHFMCVLVCVCVCVGVCCQQVVLLCRLKSAVKQCHSPAPLPRPLCLRLSGYGSAHAAMHILKLNSGWNIRDIILHTL